MAIDLFADIGKPDSKLHPQFLSVRNLPGYAPARNLIRELQKNFADPDGNFVEQFQTFGFDARTFEFFLFVMLEDAGHEVDRSHDRPDFLITKDGLTAAVEAVTANPQSEGTIQPYLNFPKGGCVLDAIEHLEQTIPIRLGSPLYSKLKKKYWTLPQMQGKPLILAIQDFHTAGALLSTSSGLGRYLYGQGQVWWHDEDGNLVIEGHALAQHKLGTKRIPSGYFNQPDAENISAVLFCNTGTMAKFNRMGHQDMYYDERVRMVRWGTCYRHDPNAAMPAPFVYEVGDPEMDMETWRQGTVLFQNPNALHPLPSEWFGAALEEELVDGARICTFAEPFLPYASMTQIFVDAPLALVQQFGDAQIQGLLSIFPE
ncbi:hypothetical protein [Paraburkholderia tropica]|uniref:hypothetical protein n=1 Tax=Paraburkholderia tropica TaxID=92647 RepID=UPI0007ED9B9F|nr:hypothetical protein [Paraburkholderia tropica]OBR47202.1 hypothetical protein A6456_32920 [Paraburkholderia tropica]